MSENRFILILTILIFVLSGFIGWHLLSPDGNNKEISVKKQASILDGGTTHNKEEVKMIGSRESVSLTISADRNRVAYYDRASGAAFEVGLDGSSERALSANRLTNFLSTIWSPTKKEVVSEFAAPENSRVFSYYNYTTKKSSKLPMGIKSLAFSPSGDRIAYFKEETDGLFGVFISAPDGSTPKKIISTRITGATIYWPLKTMISLRSDNEDHGSSLFLISMDGEMTKIVSDKTLLLANWRADGESVLVSYASEDVNVLAVVDPKSGAEKRLGIGSRADDCVWSSSETIICASNGSGEEPYQNGGLYEIKIKDNSSVYLPGSEKAGEGVNEILVDPTNSYVVFTSSKDGRVFSLRR